MARIKSSRLLRALAVFFMVPIVLLSNPTMAGAASSGTMTFHLEGSGLESTIPGVSNTTCQIPWAVNAGGMILGSSSRCDGGPDYSPGYCQPFEGACGSFGLVVKGMTGETCGSAAMEPFDIGGGVTSVKAGLGGGYVAIGDDCVPVEACLSYYFEPAMGGATDVSTCVPLSVDQVEEPPSTSCDYGTVSAPLVTDHKLESASGGVMDGGQYSSGHYRLTGSGGGTTTGMEASGKPWVIYYVYPRTAGATGLSVGSVQAGGTEHIVLYRTVTPGASAPWTLTVSDWSTQNFYPNWPGTEQYPKPNVIGVGAFRLPQDVGQSLTLSPTEQRRRVGITDAGLCSWYWGAKVASPLTGYPDSDDPVSDMPTGPPVEPEDPEAPVVNPPVSDEPDTDTGLLAGLLAILRAILAAIGNIVGAILDGIKRLFLPADGFMEGKWAGVEAKWDDTSPGKYLDTLAGIEAGSVSGCGGLPLNVNLGHGISVDEHIGAACSGSMASAASVTRAVVTAMVAIGGAIACVRAVGSGLGWNPGLRADT